MSSSMIETLQESDLEAIYYKIKAFFNKKVSTTHFNHVVTSRFQPSKLGYFDIEAEVVFPYVRQFDGKWIKIQDDSFDIENYISSLANKQLLNVEKYENNFIITASSLRANNLDFGIFGVPDTEVYSDDIEYQKELFEFFSLLNLV